MYWEYYWVILPALLIGIYAQYKIQSSFSKYQKISNGSRLTGYDVARAILDRNGMTHVEVKRGQGTLTDHYDPRAKAITLSPSVYDSNSIASMAVAAHEVGHALQDAEDYAFLKFRTNIFPLARFSSQLFLPFLIGGFIIHPRLLDIGIILFMVGVLFQIITLPVEFNASSRALSELSHDLAPQNNLPGIKEVLSAAALTYVASATMAIGQLLRLLLMTRRQD